MAHKITEIYYLTSVEYALLLAGIGVKQIHTLQPGQLDIDEGKICLAMNHLYQTRLIDSTKDTFVIREALKELLNGMKEAEYAVFVRSGYREEQAVCCFSVLENSQKPSCDRKNSLKKFVAVQLSETDADSYQLYDMDETEFTEKIQDEFLDSRKYKPVLEEEAMYQEIRESQSSISKEAIRRYHNLCFIAEQIEMRSGRVKKKALVRLTSEGRSLEVLDEGKAVTECRECEEADILEAVRYVSAG